MRTMASFLLTMAATGCVVYDEQLVHDTAEQPPTSERPPATEPTDSQAGPLWLSPAGGVQGDVLIASLYGDGSVDLDQVVDVTFYGDSALSILAEATHGRDEYLLTVSVPSTSAAGDNHLLVTLADGRTWFVEDAFAVVGDPAEIPPSQGGGDGCP